ncbi:hypothetical protein RRG08_025384 [Elysia crispata]|uniref:Uncharacterized protein n=1 Tax=Elysia crispata TaxID=231223 RepID=A0AAE1E9W5_9GAST|nr:hypothetical protein RRG08_025384 [Elysia crispata]
MEIAVSRFACEDRRENNCCVKSSTSHTPVASPGGRVGRSESFWRVIANFQPSTQDINNEMSSKLVRLKENDDVWLSLIFRTIVYSMQGICSGLLGSSQSSTHSSAG